VDYALEADDGEEPARDGGGGDSDEDDDAEQRAGALPALAAQKDVGGLRGHGGGEERARGERWKGDNCWMRELMMGRTRRFLAWPRRATIASKENAPLPADLRLLAGGMVTMRRMFANKT
jgi:hypothetical protein